MVGFVKGSDPIAPFGINSFLRSTKDVKDDSFTLSAASVPTEQANGSEQKIAQPGELLAKITSGPEAGKVGPFMAGATDGRQETANIVGLLRTALPWQLLEMDREVSVIYEASVYQGRCTERNASGVRIPLSNTTALAVDDLKGIQINWR